MNILNLIPQQVSAIPVSVLICKVLSITAFIVHIIFVNILLGSGMFYSFYEDRGLRNWLEKNSKQITILLAFAINFGVAAFLFLQVLYGSFIYPSMQIMAIWVLSIVILLIIAYFNAYNSSEWFTVLYPILYIGFIFVNVMTLMLEPNNWVFYFYSAKGFFVNFFEMTMFPRFLHFLLASIAVGGLAVSFFNKLNKELGLKWFIYASFGQIITGFWIQIRLPKNIYLLFMGNNSFYTGLFIASLILLGLAIVFAFKNKLWLTSISSFFIIVFMAIIRDGVRDAYLEPYFSQTKLTVVSQYSSFWMFIASVIIGILVIGYLLKLNYKKA